MGNYSTILIISWRLSKEWQFSWEKSSNNSIPDNSTKKQCREWMKLTLSSIWTMEKCLDWWVISKWNTATLYWVAKEWQWFSEWRMALTPKFIPPWLFLKTILACTPFEGWIKMCQESRVVPVPGDGWIRGFLWNYGKKKIIAIRMMMAWKKNCTWKTGVAM